MPVSLKNNTIGEYYPPQLLSQKLNNRAAFLITTGHYEEGIALLTKALKLTSNSQVDTPADQHQATCNCKACSLESCLIMEHDPSMSSLMIDQLTSTQNQGQQQEQEDQQGYYCPKPNTSSSSNSSSSDDEMFHRTSMGLCSLPATASQLGSRNAQQRRNLKSPSTLSTSTESSLSSSSAVDTSTATATTTITDFGFVYRRPLLVNQQCIDEMHDMGITLSLLILFNLALAHHLKAIASFNTQQVSSSLSNSSFKTKKSSLKALQQALQLYELAYQLHIDCIQQSEESSSVSNSNQQPHGLESSSNNNNNNVNDNNSDDEYNRSIGSLRFTMIISNNLGEVHHATGSTEKHTLCLQHLLSAIMYVVDSNLVVLNSNEMDGFYSNVAPIMGLSKKDICAQAA